MIDDMQCRGSLLAAIVRQAALDWVKGQQDDARRFLDAAGLLDRAPIISAAAGQHEAVAGRPGRREQAATS